MLRIETWKRVLIWGVCVIGLLLAMPNAFYSRVEGHNDAVATIAQEGETPELVAPRDAWPSFLPSGLVNLGLDLRGGAHLLVEVRVEEVHAARMKAMWPEVRDALRAERSAIGTIGQIAQAPGDQLQVRLKSRPETMGQAIEIVRGLARPVVSLADAGSTDIEVTGVDGILTIELSDAEKAASDDRTVRQALEIIRNRIDAAGTREPTIQRQGATRILVQVPGVGSAQDIKDLIGTPAQLRFQAVLGSSPVRNDTPGIGQEVLPARGEENLYYTLDDVPVVTGDDLVDAQPSFDRNGVPSVNFRFNPHGARVFGDYTAENIGSPFAIVLDGEVISAPVIRGHIPGGSGEISGNFTVEESTELAILLRAGALPTGLDFLEERTIGPELGADSIKAGQIACVAAFLLVLIFMGVSYGRFGIYANIALILNVGLIFGLLSLIGATLTLPGIAGIVLTIGMAVDANVLIFERIREELRSAKGPARAIEQGYEKALSAIVDANITTFITAVILFVMGSGPVKGFAITLGAGILTSVFTAFFVTRLMVVSWFESKRPRAFEIKGIRLVPLQTSWNFFRLWVASVGASGVAMIASILLFAIIGLNFGIDFRGGTTIRTESTQAVDVGDYRDALTPLGLGDVSITQVFDPGFDEDQHVTQIRIEAQEGAEAVTKDLIELLETALSTADPGLKLPFAAVESVGPKVSGELIMTAVYAVLAAIAAVLFYVWLRFEWQFALGAVAALVHDIVLTIGIFALLGIKFDLAIIAALLTIVGYSLNDTVVVFDRVRENLRKYKKLDLREVLNLSINETLGRTVMTSVTTLLALLALFVLGGDVIRGFVFAMIWGVVVGTYSSVFVASSILLWLGVKRDWSKPGNTAGNQFANIDA